MVAATALVASMSGCSKAPDAAAAAPARDPGTVVMLTTLALQPYTYLDKETGEMCGIDIDIVRAATEKLGLKLVVKQIDFEDMLLAVKNGEADVAACGLTITEGRSRSVDFSIPYALEGSAFLYRKGGKVPTMITIETMSIAVVESMTQDFYLARHGIDPVRFKSIDEAISALVAEKVDAVAYDRPAIKMIADESNGLLEITPLETREKYGIAVNKSKPELLAAVNEVIRERLSK